MAALLLLASLVSVAAALILLRRTGPGWRVGRLLAAAPERSLAEVASMVERGEVAYIQVEGRISSDEEFPDENDNPLVYQRRRLQRRDGRRGWATFDDQRVAVPFGLEQRGDHVAIDIDALGDGLVVVPRLSIGLASELPGGFEAAGTAGSAIPGMSPETPVRLRLDQVSATDHATAAGVPARGTDRAPILTAGLGRPLLLTTLEPAAAMRILASEQRPSVLAASGLLVLAAILLALAVSVALLGVATTVTAATLEQGITPAASPGAATTATLAPGTPAGPGSTRGPLGGDVVSPGDPRSEGSGPGLVGSPLLILLGVVLIGLATAALTAAAARLGGRS